MLISSKIVEYQLLYWPSPRGFIACKPIPDLLFAKQGNPETPLICAWHISRNGNWPKVTIEEYEMHANADRAVSVSLLTKTRRTGDNVA